MKIKIVGMGIDYQFGIKEMKEAIDSIDIIGNQILFMEYSDTITTTRRYGVKSLLLTESELLRIGIKIFETDRGGDATFHGPGQLICYPILKLPNYIGVLDYVRALEFVLLEACRDLGVTDAHLRQGYTGIWIENKKLISMGIGISGQVTKHGFSLNLTTNLERFQSCLIPCGLVGFGVTSLERELGRSPAFNDVINVISCHLGKTCYFAGI